MTLQQRITLLAQAIGADVKALTGMIGSLAALSTTNKTNIVAAINEVLALVGTGGGSSVVDDSLNSSTAKTYSIDKIKSQVAALKAELLGGVPAEAFDTLKEIADYIGNDQTATSGLVTAVGFRVRVDAAQAFDNTQKAQARANIDAFGSVEIGDPDTNLVALYTTAKI